MKKDSDELYENKLINRAGREVPGFQELIYRFERSISMLGRSPSTFKNYSQHIAAIALHYGKIPTELDRIGGLARAGSSLRLFFK